MSAKTDAHPVQVERADGAQEWRRAGLLDRRGGPARIDRDGAESWYWMDSPRQPEPEEAQAWKAQKASELLHGGGFRAATGSDTPGHARTRSVERSRDGYQRS